MEIMQYFSVRLQYLLLNKKVHFQVVQIEYISYVWSFKSLLSIEMVDLKEVEEAQT